jgi:dTDP-4-dehydrorhamnose reductase
MVLGAGGMLGNAMMRILTENADCEVCGTVRSEGSKRLFGSDIAHRLLADVDAENHDSLLQAFSRFRPDVLINCVGLTKQLVKGDQPLRAISVNALLPHRLAGLCKLYGSRLIHISTDCIFSGNKGGYRESDRSDADDLYGRSKFLGEVAYPHTITLRTSVIGHGLQNTSGLVDWFLAQQGHCSGFTRAIFSGLPTVVLAQIVRDLVIPRPDLSGIYHVAAAPISKYNLLSLVGKVYGKQTRIDEDDRLGVDRSLNAERFRDATGYAPPDWAELIRVMHAFR